jgi:hypothetical protein
MGLLGPQPPVIKVSSYLAALTPIALTVRPEGCARKLKMTHISESFAA